MMNKKKVIFLLTGVIVAVGFIVAGTFIYEKLPKVSASEYTKYCLFFAVLDDEICRNEIEGNTIVGKEIVFPPKTESIHYRYKMFLKTYTKYSKKQLEEEMKRLEKRLEDSKQYIGKSTEELNLGVQK